MSQYKYAEIADTVYFWFAANATTGAADDGATPLYDVRLAGAAADAAPTASGTPTLLSHSDYGAGLHEIAIDTSSPAPWAAGEYAVFCTLTVSTVNPGGFCGSFKLRTAGASALDVNAIALGGTVQSATDLKDFADTGYNPATHKVAGVLLTDTTTANSDMRGTNSALTDKTGFSLSAAGNTAVIDEFKTQAAADPTGFKVNVIEVNGTSQTANDNGADINAILTDTGSTLDTLIKDIPTTAEFEARTLLAADYVVVGDTIAGVTLCTTCTTNSDMRGTNDANTVVPPTVLEFEARTLLAADYVVVGDTIAGVTLCTTCTTNSDMRGTDSANTVVPPTVLEFEARTLLAADYVVVGDTIAGATVVGSVSGAVDSVATSVTTDAASRTASKADVSGLSTHDAAAVVTAVKEMTGVTAGDTWTFATLCKVLGAILGGHVKNKAGETDVLQYLDPDDGTTVVAELTYSETTQYSTWSFP